MRVTTHASLLAVILLLGRGQSFAKSADPEHPVPTKSAPSKIKNADRTAVDIAKTTRPSLVKITQVGRDGPFGIGSGFVISSEGLIATNKHVIGEARRLRVETSDGRVHEVTEIVANDTRLDLAILRVATKNLVPLELADSDQAKQGEPIVAMGNPEGLSYSVVEGVISEPQRDIEGLPMIQVALPIERGNSGGPLLDRKGHVLGLLTLKSAVTENLGFAMPVNALKKLIAKPNPVPMERWLTMGVLNPRLWKPTMGALWTQRAGVINVSQMGDGFGGRSLCLWHEKLPEENFESTVTVKLEDEAGAAGLAFCSDGADQHYGFYPTGGKLRLTRFEGPDVESWQILADVNSDNYRPGEWNTLRVHVSGEDIRCFVNEAEVIRYKDSRLRGGKAGLCKFRSTVASFKGFQLGADLSPKPLPPEIESKLTGALQSLVAGMSPKEETLKDLLKDAESGQQVLKSRQLALEKETILLKDLRDELHRRAIRQQLSAELSKPDEEADLFRCALLLSKHDNPELDIEGYERHFAQMVHDLEGCPELAHGTRSAVERLNAYLFKESGFHGSRSDYDSRSNSYLNEVLDDREGLPITLSVIYLELARKLRIKNVEGIPLPNRFMIGFRESDSDEFSLVDVFEGGKFWTMEEGVELVSNGRRIPEKFKRPALKRDIILRMIRNLMNSSKESRDQGKQTLPYLDLVVALDVESNAERVTRAMLREKSGDKAGALEDVNWLLEHLPESITFDQKDLLQQWIERLSH